MNTIIICRDGPDGRERARDRILSRPSVGGSTHSRHAGSDFPSLDLGDGSFARVQGRGGCRRTTGHRAPLKFIPTIRGVGSLIPGLRRALQPRKQSRSGFAKGFQNSILSAGSAGLVGCFDRHEATKEKFPHDGKHRARSGNLAARKRNAF